MAITNLKDLINSLHPEFVDSADEVARYRKILRGGDDFINCYLQKYNKRESDDDFQLRKSMTYNPAFALSALTDTRNSIYQKMIDVSRIGGSASYQKAVSGEDGGVDTHGSTMNRFIGEEVMLELMGMGKVGILIDRPQLPDGATLRDTANKTPYLYAYKREDIIHWYQNSDGVLIEVLLKDTRAEFHDGSSLLKGTVEQYRHMVLRPEGVVVTQIATNGETLGVPQTLKLNRIPFVIGDLSRSLLTDISKYQIALLNLASSGIFYVQHSNFIFYTEQMKQTSRGNNLKGDTSIKAGPSGSVSGRAYLEGLDRPAFISPPQDAPEANIKMQNHLKAEIRELINLNLSSLGNDRGLESGVGYIAQEIQRVEQEIAEVWQSYETTKSTPINVEVQYPSNFEVLSDKERLEETLKLSDIRKTVPSITFRKEITKIMATIAMSSKISAAKLESIHKEIDIATTIITDPEKIQKDFELGLVSGETASIASGYPEGESKIAMEEKSERAVATLQAQMAFKTSGPDNNVVNAAARGVGEDSTSENAIDEKKVTKEIKEISGGTK